VLEAGLIIIKSGHGQSQSAMRVKQGCRSLIQYQYKIHVKTSAQAEDTQDTLAATRVQAT